MQLLLPKLTGYIHHRPTPHQAAFLQVPQLEALYGGAAGGGKTDALLMAALQYVDSPAGYHAVIVRDSFAAMGESGAIIHRAREWLAGTDATYNSGDHRFTFPSGADLSFRPMDQAGDERAFMGSEYSFIGVDELTTLTETEYRFLLTRLRRPASSRLPLRMRATAMPYGPGVAWVRRMFVDSPASSGRIFIPALLVDNPYLDTESYTRTLSALEPVTRAQMLHGDWSVQPEGGMFHRDWFDAVMREDIPRRQVPLCRYWDLASTEPAKGKDPDYTCGVLLGRDDDGQAGVFDVVRAQESALGVEQLIKQTSASDAAFAAQSGSPLAIRMEQEPGASGAALVDHYLRQVLPGSDFQGVRPTGSKTARAAPVASLAEAGHLYIKRGDWNDAFLDELCAFPLAGHDDQVDALSGAFACLVAESQYLEEQYLEYDPELDVIRNLTTGEVYDPPWPRDNPWPRSPY
ncbi:MAG: phage terminase large subunit [Actinomycetota bacterium]